jgi:hypothetical protein
MSDDKDQSLTEADKIMIFKLTTASLPRRYGDAIRTGMSDEELSNALHSVLGIFGGSGGPGRPSISFAGSGLRIWGGWHNVNHVTEKPLFAGNATIAMARTVYKINDPGNRQLSLF